MTQELINLYQAAAPAVIGLGSAGFAASFAFNNTIAQIRTNLYESDEYARVAKIVDAIDGSDAMRPLRNLMRLTLSVRYFSLVLVLAIAFMPKSTLWPTIVGLLLILVWLVTIFLWLASVRSHQKHEVEITSRKLDAKRDATKINSGLDPIHPERPAAGT